MRSGGLGALRERFHPLHHARRTRGLARGLAAADVQVWGRVDGIRWPVRVRLIRHASYLIRSTVPERRAGSLALALAERVGVRRFWDVGANFGYYSWLLKSRFPELEVEMFEPDPDNQRLIEATLARTALQGVALHRVAVSDSAGEAVFARDLVSGATGALADSSLDIAAQPDPLLVQTVTLDGSAAAGVDFIKIDVEGHEERVLAGAAALLKSDAPFVLFECFHGDDAAPTTLRGMGYELFDAESETSPTETTSNYLAVPPQHQAAVRALLRDRRSGQRAE